MKANKKNNEDDIGLHQFTTNCNRGIAVFTDGRDLDLQNIATGHLTSAMWHANPKRIAVGDCLVVFHWTKRYPDYTATVHVGSITAIDPVAGKLHKYSADNVQSFPIYRVNWVKFSGSSSPIRYF